MLVVTTTVPAVWKYDCNDLLLVGLDRTHLRENWSLSHKERVRGRCTEGLHEASHDVLYISHVSRDLQRVNLCNQHVPLLY